MDRRSPSFADRMTESLIAEVRTLSSALAEMNAETRNLRDTVGALSKIIKDGNGQAPLLTRVLLLEKAYEDAIKRVAAAEAALLQVTKDDKQARIEKSKSRWSFYATIVPGILALIGTILALIIK